MARSVNRLPHVQHLHRPDQFDAAMSDQVVLIAPRCRNGQSTARSGQPSFTAVPEALTISMLLPTVS